jgi:hypothetical protein
MHRRGGTRWLGPVALVIALVALAACGERFGSARDAPAGRSAITAMAADPSRVPADPGPASSASWPVLSPAPAASTAAGPSALPSAPLSVQPALPPDLSELEHLLDQLTDALANDRPI